MRFKALVAAILALGLVLGLAAPALACEYQGLTPGYWKNHTGAWTATGYTTSQTLESVFDVPDGLGMDDVTLLEALSFGGGRGDAGGARILLRAAVAGLLNAADPDIDYFYTTGGLIAATNTALTGGRAAMLTLAADFDYNNNLGVGE